MKQKAKRGRNAEICIFFNAIVVDLSKTFSTLFHFLSFYSVIVLSRKKMFHNRFWWTTIFEQHKFCRRKATQSLEQGRVKMFPGWENLCSIRLPSCTMFSMRQEKNRLPANLFKNKIIIKIAQNHSPNDH